LAIREQVPVLPLVVEGSGAALPKRPRDLEELKI
jgi:hypothetical protein